MGPRGAPAFIATSPAGLPNCNSVLVAWSAGRPGAVLYSERGQAMRWAWVLLMLWLLACGARGGPDRERALADLQDSAVAAFVTTRSERNLPAGPLVYRAG